MRWGIIIILAAISNELYAVELPTLAEKSIERYEDSIDRFIEKLHRDQRGLLQLLRTQSAAAAQRGDQRVVDALAAKSAEIVDQLKKLEAVFNSDDENLQKNNLFIAPKNLKNPIAVGVPQVIAIKGNDKVGFSLGPMPKGAVISLQYVGGAWTNGNHTESPDETRDNWSQCCIAATSSHTNLRNDILERVPLQTIHAPWQYELQQNYDNVTIRMGDDIYNGPGHSDNGGVAWYRIAIGQ